MTTDPIALETKPLEAVNELLTEYVVPRPIAWVLSQSNGGTADIAPFSSFTAVCNAPPLVIFAAERRLGGEPKLTTRNILATHEYVIHLVDRSSIAAAAASAIPGNEWTEKVELGQMRTAPSRFISVPRLPDCPVCLECRLYRHALLGDAKSGADLLIGEVLAIWVRDDFAGNEVVAALGIGRYVSGGDVLQIPNP